MKKSTATSTGSKHGPASEPGSDADDLWVDKFKPSTSKDLAMYHAKVKSIKEWVERAVTAHEAQRTGGAVPGFQPYVLALCGGSGCCKSTAVEVICGELGVQVKRWTDDLWEADTSARFGQMLLRPARAEFAAPGAYGGEGATSFQSSAAQRAEELSEFAVRSAYPAVMMQKKESTQPAQAPAAAVAPTPGVKAKSASADEAKRRKLNENTASSSNRNTIHDSSRSHNHPSSSRAMDMGGDREGGRMVVDLSVDDEVEDIDDDDDDFEPMPSAHKPSASKRHASARCEESWSVDDDDDLTRGSSSRERTVRRIVLIEDPPHLSLGSASLSSHSTNSDRANGPPPSDQFALMMGSFRDPVVLVISDVHGPDGFHFAADRCLPPEVKRRVTFEAIYCTPVTELNTVKALKAILAAAQAAQAALARGKGSVGVVKKPPRGKAGGAGGVGSGVGVGFGLTAEDLQEVAVTSMGDMRHATVQLQMLVQSLSLSGSGSGSGSDGRVRSAGSGPLPPHGKQSRGGKMVGGLTDVGGVGGGEGDSTYGWCEDNEPRRRDGVYSSLHGVDTLLSAKLDQQGHMTTSSSSRSGSSSSRSKSKSKSKQNDKNEDENENMATSLSNGSRNSGNNSNSSGSGSSGVLDSSEDDPDTIIDRTDMSFDLVYAFMQSNCVQAIANTHDVCTFMLADGTAERDVMDQVSDVLSVCGDLDLLMSRKYDPSSLLDRSDTSCFPEGYASALLCRAAAVARGVGSKVRYQAGKTRGAMGTWQPMYRPKILALRATRQQLGMHLQSLRNDMMKGGSGDGGGGGGAGAVGRGTVMQGQGGIGVPSMLSAQALVCDVVPVLRILEAHHRLSDTLLWRLRAIHAVATGGGGGGGGAGVLLPGGVGGGDGELQGDAAAAAWLAAVDDIDEFDD